MAGQLTVVGQTIMVTVSNGLAPLGVLDDIKTRSFSANSWDETVIAAVPNAVPGPGSTLVCPFDIKMELENPNIDGNSFISIPVPVQLIPRNGVVVFPAGTVLNFDLDGDGIPDSIKTNVRYQYIIPNIIGDDSTAASSKCTIWFQRMIFETNMFETNAVYGVNSNLFVNECGMYTSRQYSTNIPSVGICLAPPTALTATLQILLL
jgi:hypothetical protein